MSTPASSGAPGHVAPDPASPEAPTAPDPASPEAPTASGLVDPDAAASGSATPATLPLERVLGILRVSLHVLFGALLALGALRVWASTPERLSSSPVLPLCIALALTYLLGTVWEARFAHSRALVNPRPFALPWLAAITVLWCGLLVLANDFVWLLFPLVFFAAHLLPGRAGALGGLALWAIATGTTLCCHPAELSAGALVGPLLGTVIALGGYRGYAAIHREARRNLELAQALLAAQSELARTARQSARMEERERLSREIHDTVAQGLSSIVLISRAARKNLGRGAVDAATEQITVVETQAAAALAEARRFVRELAHDAPVDLEESVSDVVTNAGTTARATLGEQAPLFDVVRDGVPNSQRPPIPEAIARVAVRAAQELTVNVVKHAHASRCVVTLGVWPDAVTIDVVDNGRGLPAVPPPRTADSGYGLAGLRARVAGVGGEVSLESSPGEGTAVQVRLPLNGQPK